MGKPVTQSDGPVEERDDGRDQSGPGHDGHGATLKDMLRFLPDVARLLVAVARDPRVPWYAKAGAAAAAAYVLSPVDVIPDVLPVVGQLDDAWVVVKALRYLLREAGYDVIADLWPGTDEGLAVLLMVAGVHE